MFTWLKRLLAPTLPAQPEPPRNEAAEMQADRRSIPPLPDEGWATWYATKNSKEEAASVQIVKGGCLKRRLDYILDQRQRLRQLGYQLTPVVITAEAPQLMRT